MRDLLLLAVQLIVALAKLARPDGARSVVAECLLLTHQLIISGGCRRCCYDSTRRWSIERIDAYSRRRLMK